MRSQSPWGRLKSWQMLSVIVKVRDDLRQEQLACQLVRRLGQIWEAADIPIFVYP